MWRAERQPPLQCGRLGDDRRGAHSHFHHIPGVVSAAAAAPEEAAAALACQVHGERQRAAPAEGDAALHQCRLRVSDLLAGHLVSARQLKHERAVGGVHVERSRAPRAQRQRSLAGALSDAPASAHTTVPNSGHGQPNVQDVDGEQPVSTHAYELVAALARWGCMQTAVDTNAPRSSHVCQQVDDGVPVERSSRRRRRRRLRCSRPPEPHVAAELHARYSERERAGGGRHVLVSCVPHVRNQCEPPLPALSAAARDRRQSRLQHRHSRRGAHFAAFVIGS